jgi:hypothetical protein
MVELSGEVPRRNVPTCGDARGVEALRCRKLLAHVGVDLVIFE